ncbi:2,3-bisphosphoglycerate-independent phosphoglycerate mutase [Candidatus Woesearchaeota archaeon]|nr:MAG: 2,3-bisphosphoglycerate-independent phosphoglycerate mutase [Candidatus Woesearchaeota archaeon]
MNKVILIVLDGWGIARAGRGNAITRANPKYFEKLKKNNIYTQLNASGKYVGLLKGYIGNSEVGHLHLGAGKLVKQDLVRIHESIDDGTFFRNPVLKKAMNVGKAHALHLIGLVSDAGVHSHIKHLYALLKMAKALRVKNTYVHAILDGRDTPPKSAKKYLEALEKKGARIATIQGRYYAMDRDERWRREKRAYDALVRGKGPKYPTWQEALKKAYSRGETDEFVLPSIIDPSGRIKDGDSAILFNFRADRARQLTHSFTDKRFTKFKREPIKVHFVCMTNYDKTIKAPVAFKQQHLKNTLGEVISKAGKRQLRLAETEKWAHVTFFFNGLTDKKFPKEDRKLIPSPRISTYDKKPEMSAHEITQEAKKSISKDKYEFILINYANADMVGHTGKLRPTIKAVRVVDECLSDLVPFAKRRGYNIIITADHGNAERKRYPDGSISTAHTTNKVPCIIVSGQNIRMSFVKNPALYNIAPTVLKLMGLKAPKEMDKPALVNVRQS